MKIMKPINLSLTAVYVNIPEGGYAAYVEEIPGVNTQWETLEEAKKNLKEAYPLCWKQTRYSINTNKFIAALNTHCKKPYFCAN